MTGAEDRLRQILLADAEDIVPAGDGLQRIQQRLAARRSLRSKLIPAVAVAGVVVVAGAAAVTVSLTDKGALKPQPGHHPTSPAPTTCTGGLCEEPKPSPSFSVNGVTTSASGIPLWPVTNDAAAAGITWREDKPRWEHDAVQVTQHLLDDYLKLPGRAMPRTDENEDVALVTVTAGGRAVSTVRLVRVGRDPNGPWSVTGATATGITVTQPVDGDDVASPISTAGTATDPDTSVHLRLMSDRLLGEGYEMAGRELPWTHSLPWSGTDWSVAALVANTFNGKGDLSALTITAVRRAGSSRPDVPAPGTTFLAIGSGHVVTVDALTGAQLRQLSYPPKGAVDSDPDRGGEDGVVWVRRQGDGCTSSIIRVGLARGPAGVTVDAAPIVRRLPALSEGGRVLAWVEQPCGGGEQTVVVRGPDAKFSTTATTSERVTDLDVRDDGSAVVWLGDKVVVLPPGVTTVSAGHRLVPTQGCSVAAPVWNGDVVFAWQSCPTGWVMGRWTTGGAALSPGGGVVDGMSEPVHLAAAGGNLLVVLADHRIARVLPDRLIEIPNATKWGQPDW